MVNVDVMFNVPGHYLSERSRLFITPTLLVGDSAVDEYEPIVLDAPIYGKKTHRKAVLEGYADPYGDVAQRVEKTSREITVPYSGRLEMPEGIENGRIVAVLSADGCGQCTGIDTVEVAAVSVPAGLMDMTRCFTPSWVKPEFTVRPKEHHGKGEARLQFIVNKWDIEMDLADNRRELTGMVEALKPVLEDSLATLTSLNILGTASAEASYNYNVMLAKNRANAAKDWLSSQLDLPSSVRKIIRTGSRPEGWEPVVQAMTAAGDADSTKVRELMVKYPGPTDDAAEKYIRRLDCWPRIHEKYLAKDRKVLYDYSWTVKSFTNDAELLEMYGKRPDAFSEEEFLRVSELATNDAGRMEVYKTLLKYYPQSKTGANNLAVLYQRAGKYEDARRVLAESGAYTDEMSRYNLGLEKARQHKMAEAYELLRDYGDVNSAICALAINRTEEASEIMSHVNDNTPLAEYVRAMIAARTSNDAAFAEHLANACKDDGLRRRALSEPEFIRYKDNAGFRAIINK